MKRYSIDKLATDLLHRTAATIEVPAKHLRKPIQSVVMWHDSAETFIPQQVLLSFKAGQPKGYAQMDLALVLFGPETNVPYSQFAFEANGDPVRSEFIRTYKLDNREDWWGEILAVPRLLVVLEIDLALHGLKTTLEESGAPVAPKLAVYNGNPDTIEPIETESAPPDAIRDDLQRKLKTPVQRKAFAELCYDSKKRQDWLLKLAGK
jgi:hypothetical protein